MSPNTLTDIKDLIKQHLKMNDDHIQQYLEILKLYTTGKWIYPGAIKRKLNVSITEVYEVLSCLENAGLIKGYYEIYCNNCQHSAGEIFETFNELPEEYECEHWGCVFSGLENAILVFKVIAV